MAKSAAHGRPMLLSERKAAASLGISHTTLKRLADQGHIERVKLPGVSKAFYRSDDLGRLIGRGGI